MPTPVQVFAQIAARYGVDPDDEDAVELFFEEKAPALSEAEQAKILEELLAADGSDVPDYARKRYIEGTTAVSLSDSPAIGTCDSPLDMIDNTSALKHVAKDIAATVQNLLAIGDIDVVVNGSARDDHVTLIVKGAGASHLSSDKSELLEAIWNVTQLLLADNKIAVDILVPAPAVYVNNGRLRSASDRDVPLASNQPSADIVKTGNRVIPMEIDEAAVQLELSTDNFLMFQDPATRKACVIYKRADHRFGLIES